MGGEDVPDTDDVKRKNNRLETISSRFPLNRKQRSLLRYVICVQYTTFWVELGTVNVWTNCHFIWSGKAYIWLSVWDFQKLFLWQPCLNKLMHVENWETDQLQHDLYVDISYKFHPCMGICFSFIYTNKCEHFHKWFGTLYRDNSVLMRVQYVAQYPDGTSIRTLKTKTQFLRRRFQFSVNEVFRMKAEHFSFTMKVVAIWKLAKQSQRTPFCSGE